MQPNQQPRTYRIRVYRGNSERFRDRSYQVVLDWSHGPGLRATEGQLDGLVQALSWTDGARGKRALEYCLAVHDAATDEFICHWPAKTWLED